MEAQGKVVLGNLRHWAIQKAKGIQLTLMRQGPGDEGRVRQVTDLGGKEELKGQEGEERYGVGCRSPWRGLVNPRIQDIRSWACAS